MIFHKGSKCDYHFMLKELAKEFEGQFNYLGENTKKYTTFSVPLTKEVKIVGKNGEEITKKKCLHISVYWWWLSVRFVASSLSNHADNLAEEIHEFK